MKRFLFIILVGLAFTNSTYAVDVDNTVDYGNVDTYLEDQKFFESPNSLMMPEIQGPEYEYNDYAIDRVGGTGNYKPIDPDNMPLFKQLRLNVSNKFAKIAENRESEDYESCAHKLFKKIQFWKKNNSSNISDSEMLILSEQGSIAESIQNVTNVEVKPEDDVIALESGISEHVTEKELQLDADSITYDEESGEMVAHGRPMLLLPQQCVRVFSNEMLYNQDANILKAVGDVVVLKDSLPTKADYAEVDMNEETMLMTNIKAETQTFVMDADKAIQKDSKLVFENGYLYSDFSEVHRFHSRMVGPNFGSMVVDEEDQSLFFGDPSGNKLHLDIDEIYIDARKNHNKYLVKNMRVNRDGKHRFTWPKLTIFTDKQGDNFEANYPEFGAKRKLGMFVGPGFVFGGPNGSVIKAVPFVNYKDSDFGIGGLLKYRNTYNSTYLGYGSAADTFIMRGRQRLDDNLFLHYGANAYMNEWFLGSRMPKYMAEVYYDKKYKVDDFLAEGKPLTFRHRAGVGLMEDNDRNYYGEKFADGSMSTTRFRYMAEVSQTLYSYKNEEERFYFNLGFTLQGSAAVYGTGDTQFIGRMGPRAHVQYKNWMQDIAYFQTGFEDESPMPRYDAYRYGGSSVYISEIVRLNKYLSVGWSGMVTLSDDSPNGKMFQENRFIFAIGPDDLRVRFGYDFVRRTTFFGFDAAFDTKGTTVTYKKMEIKNPERLSKNKSRDERKLAFSPAQKASEQNVSIKKLGKVAKEEEVTILEYAQVIEIEDPDKEVID